MKACMDVHAFNTRTGGWGGVATGRQMGFASQPVYLAHQQALCLPTRPCLREIRHRTTEWGNWLPPWAFIHECVGMCVRTHMSTHAYIHHAHTLKQFCLGPATKINYPGEPGEPGRESQECVPLSLLLGGLLFTFGMRHPKKCGGPAGWKWE